MLSNSVKENLETKLIKAIVSLAASGILLFAAIGFAWFAVNEEPTASNLSLSADYSECDVNYKLYDSNGAISASQVFTNAKPGDIVTCEINITNIKKDGMLNVQLLNIEYVNTVVIDGEVHDIRDAYAVTVLEPVEKPSVSLSGMTDINLLTNYPVSKNDDTTFKFQLDFLSNPPGISDVNVFQGDFTLKISTVKVSIV